MTPDKSSNPHQHQREFNVRVACSTWWGRSRGLSSWEVCSAGRGWLKRLIFWFVRVRSLLDTGVSSALGSLGLGWRFRILSTCFPRRVLSQIWIHSSLQSVRTVKFNVFCRRIVKFRFLNQFQDGVKSEQLLQLAGLKGYAVSQNWDSFEIKFEANHF